MNRFTKLTSLLLIALFLVSCKQTGKNKAENVDQQQVTLSDEQLLDTIQYYTFQYFWDGAEPVSGMARERFHVDGNYPQNDKNTVTSGGSGFGIMALIVGMERGFISREAGMKRMEKIMNFLESADRFHGVSPHWWNGETGKVKPFSRKDNGGDIVETSYLIQGLYTMKQYLDTGKTQEEALYSRIDTFIEEVEWSWHERNDAIYWHWSPEYEWEMNFPIRGFNECLITYIMAAASRSHSISPDTYHKGWARSGDIKGEHTQYGYTLELNHNGAENYGGPLFWIHYSFLGLDPRGLKDTYADYWRHNVSHTMINYKYCIENPGGYEGYGENCWGLTASYSVNRAAMKAEGDEAVKLANELPVGYAGHCPERDLGVISPTAALSSMPYAPEEVMQAARFFYKDLGDRLMGPYGFYDAFSLEYDWFPKRYLAIDQGPIVVMIENYRSGLLWDLFMQNPEVKEALQKLGFQINKDETQ